MNISAKDSFSDIDTKFLDNHTCEFRFNKVGGYKKLNYTIEYNADNGKRGEEGEVVLDGEENFERKIILGTC